MTISKTGVVGESKTAGLGESKTAEFELRKQADGRACADPVGKTARLGAVCVVECTILSESSQRHRHNKPFRELNPKP